MNYVYKYMQTPIGRLKLVASANGMAAILFEKESPNRVRIDSSNENGAHPILRQAEKELAEYFSGQRQSFSLPLDMVGTDFQKTVWNALLKIPFGKTKSYGELAHEIARPKASRAVGAANGKNPLAIVVPCHRVIGGSGKLVGFAGGLSTKSFLLELENRKN